MGSGKDLKCTVNDTKEQNVMPISLLNNMAEPTNGQIGITVITVRTKAGRNVFRSGSLNTKSEVTALNLAGSGNERS